MHLSNRRRLLRRAGVAALLVALMGGASAIGGDRGLAQAEPDAARIAGLRAALRRLPYYGVFDFLAFKYDRGTVTLLGYAYAPRLREDAEAAVRQAPGVDTVDNQIEALPASLNDDRIRRAAFAAIYTDDVLSRYAPGGAMQARYDSLQFSRFPNMQPLGSYPIHLVVKGGRLTLLGVVDTTGDRQMAEVRARQVAGVFGVENELLTTPPR